MNEDQNPKRFDLEERTFAFAKHSRALVRRLSKTIGNVEDSRQLIRSSGSVGANYIEANESLSKKDFVLRIKICRKEAKERPACAGSAGADEHFWRDRAEKRVI